MKASIKYISEPGRSLDQARINSGIDRKA